MNTVGWNGAPPALSLPWQPPPKELNILSTQQDGGIKRFQGAVAERFVRAAANPSALSARRLGCHANREIGVGIRWSFGTPENRPRYAHQKLPAGFARTVPWDNVSG